MPLGKSVNKKSANPKGTNSRVRSKEQILAIAYAAAKRKKRK